MKTNYRLKGNQKVYILPISDLHIGSEQFNEPYFDYCLDKIDEIKQDKRIYLCGDLIEVASKQVGNSSFKTNLTVEEQIDTVINYLKPFRNDIVYTCMGNHESRLAKEHDFNVMHTIAKALKCDYGHQTIDSFNINGEPIRIYAAHGKGSSAHHYTAQSKFIRETQQIDADILLNGHNHRVDHFTLPIRTPTGIRRKHFVFTGAFLKYNGYAEAMQLPILPEAFLHLSINKDFIVHDNIFFIDERRSDLMENQ